MPLGKFHEHEALDDQETVLDFPIRICPARRRALEDHPGYKRGWSIRPADLDRPGDAQGSSRGGRVRRRFGLGLGKPNCHETRAHSRRFRCRSRRRPCWRPPARTPRRRGASEQRGEAAVERPAAADRRGVEFVVLERALVSMIKHVADRSRELHILGRLVT